MGGRSSTCAGKGRTYLGAAVGGVGWKFGCELWARVGGGEAFGCICKGGEFGGEGWGGVEWHFKGCTFGESKQIYHPKEICQVR